MGLPFLQNFSAPLVETATRQTGNVLTNATQDVVNYNFASTGQKVAEAVKKLVASGEIGSFSSAARGVGITEIDGMYAATDEMTDTPIEILDEAPQPIPAAALVGTDQEDRTQKLKVILRASPGGNYATGGNLNSYDEIILDVMPRIAEKRDAQYEEFTPLHHPGAIQKYIKTSARTWSIDGQLISRTPQEATRNLIYLNLIRSWTMPFYGEGTASSEAAQFLGAPPPIITLTAYGDRMIGPVKTVLSSYDWNFPNDVDYIPTLEKEPFPVILSISLFLTEAWSPSEYSGFNIVKYKMGQLDSSFKSLPRSAVKRQAVNQTAAVPYATQADVRRVDNKIIGMFDRSEPIVATQADVRRVDNSIIASLNNKK